MENSISINLPIAVTYGALENVLKQQFTGEVIPKPEPGKEANPYAQILDVGIAGSSGREGTIILHVQLKILRTLLKRDRVDLYVLATVGYDNERQQVFVQQFNMESKTSSSFYNKALEVLVNKVAYNQIIQRTRVSLQDIIGGQLNKVNGLLAEGLKLKGLKLLGSVNQVAVQDIALLQEKVSLNLQVQANLEADIFDLLGLMPPKESEVLS